MAKSVIRNQPWHHHGLALALSLTALLSACGGGDQPPAQPQAPTTAAQQAPAGVAPAATPAEAAPVPVDQLLKSASLAVAEERLVAPPGNNAVEYYLAVTAQDSSNVQATQALVDIFPLAAQIAEREIAQKNVAEGERIVGLLDRASPNSYTVTTIRGKLDALKTNQQREADAQVAAQQAAAAAAAAAAQQAAAPSPTPEPSPTQVAAAPRPTPSAAPSPVAPPPAPSPAATAPTGGETRDARVVRQVPPVFPTQAARKRQQGWVELEFTVGVDGKVKNVSVVRSQPARVFDREAIRAMQQWTFEPALQGGQPVETRKRRRIEFTL